MTATPWGFRDILPQEAQLREDIALTVKGCLREHHYLPVETPLLEDKRSLDQAGRLADTPFKLFDDDGGLLVVRPDNTLPIVRLVSSRMNSGELPLRLRYEAPVVREQPRLTGGSRQFTQLGYELIGEGGRGADAETVELSARIMTALGLDDWRIVCGSVRPFKDALACADDPVLARDALALVHANNFIDLDDRVAKSGVAPLAARAICEIPRMHGGLDALDRVDRLLEGAGVGAGATDELRALYGDLALRLSLDEETLAKHVSFDFSLMNSFDYYTGLVFKAYAGGLSDPVGSGGRYDSVFDGAFGPSSHVPAAGFAFSLERLEGAAGSLRAADGDYAAPREAASPLRIAVPKGSLRNGTIEALEAAGLDVSALRDSGRRLIVPSRDVRPGGAIGDVELVIVRPTDAPAFVACGGADCGICGRDSLIEADLNLLQLVNLGYGACRFIEAEPAGRGDAAQRAYARRGSLRVATKYPRIAASWYENRGVNAEIVSLHGNIELGPIVGMTDRIVDITATGTTLRENNLVITGELMECTARFFVNPGRARLDARVLELANRLASWRREQAQQAQRADGAPRDRDHAALA